MKNITNHLFWGNDPNILLNKKLLFEFFPNKNMTIEGKINAITRFTIYISIILTIYSKKTIYLITECIVLIIIYLYYKQNYQKKKNINSDISINKITKINKKNPYNNKLVLDNMEIYNKNIETIIPNIYNKDLHKNNIYEDKLFNNIHEKSLARSFYHINNNDGNEQTQFAKWLYY